MLPYAARLSIPSPEGRATTSVQGLGLAVVASADVLSKIISGASAGSQLARQQSARDSNSCRTLSKLLSFFPYLFPHFADLPTATMPEPKRSICIRKVNVQRICRIRKCRIHQNSKIVSVSVFLYLIFPLWKKRRINCSDIHTVLMKD